MRVAYEGKPEYLWNWPFNCSLHTRVLSVSLNFSSFLPEVLTGLAQAKEEDLLQECIQVAQNLWKSATHWIPKCSKKSLREIFVWGLHWRCHRWTGFLQGGYPPCWCFGGLRSCWKIVDWDQRHSYSRAWSRQSSWQQWRELERRTEGWW